MPRSYKTLFLLGCGAAALGLASGCASISKDECLVGDWYTVGYQDGVEGRPMTRVQSHREECLKYGQLVNVNDYRGGYERGLGLYCTYDNGLAVGRRGGGYAGVCAGQPAQAFRAGYDEGRIDYERAQHLRFIDNRIDEINHRLDEIYDRLDEGELNDKERRELRRERRDLDHEKERLQTERALIIVAPH